MSITYHLLFLTFFYRFYIQQLTVETEMENLKRCFKDLMQIVKLTTTIHNFESQKLSKIVNKC